MKELGFVRRVDELGRITLPKEMRDVLHISQGTPLEFYTENEGIVLKKYAPDNLSQKLNEFKCILNEHLEEIGLEQCISIESELDKIQTILNTSA